MSFWKLMGPQNLFFSKLHFSGKFCLKQQSHFAEQSRRFLCQQHWGPKSGSPLRLHCFERYIDYRLITPSILTSLHMVRNHFQHADLWSHILNVRFSRRSQRKQSRPSGYWKHWDIMGSLISVVLLWFFCCLLRFEVSCASTVTGTLLAQCSTAWMQPSLYMTKPQHVRYVPTTVPAGWSLCWKLRKLAPNFWDAFMLLPWFFVVLLNLTCRFD